MSSALGMALGAGVPITIAGQDVVMPPLTMDDITAIGNWMNSRRANPLELVAQSLKFFPPNERDERWSQAVKAAADVFSIDPGEVMRFVHKDVEAFAMSIWVPLDRVYPGRFSIEQVKSYVTEEGSKNTPKFNDLKEQHQQVNGLDAVGNSSGQSPDQATESQPATAEPAVQG